MVSRTGEKSRAALEAAGAEKQAGRRCRQAAWEPKRDLVGRQARSSAAKTRHQAGGGGT